MLYLISLIGFVTDKLGVFRQADAKRVIDLLFNIVLTIAIIYTFMTMAYIIALNPNLLTGFAVGTPLWNGVFLATCIASAIGTACMAFLANKPFAMAPGMGLNSFFAVVVANIAVINDCDYTSAFQAALVIILIEGIVFLVLTVLKVREKIVEAIPLGVRSVSYTHLTLPTIA